MIFQKKKTDVLYVKMLNNTSSDINVSIFKAFDTNWGVSKQYEYVIPKSSASYDWLGDPITTVISIVINGATVSYSVTNLAINTYTAAQFLSILNTNLGTSFTGSIVGNNFVMYENTNSVIYGKLSLTNSYFRTNNTNQFYTADNTFEYNPIITEVFSNYNISIWSNIGYNALLNALPSNPSILHELALISDNPDQLSEVLLFKAVEKIYGDQKDFTVMPMFDEYGKNNYVVSDIRLNNDNGFFIDGNSYVQFNLKANATLQMNFLSTVFVNPDKVAYCLPTNMSEMSNNLKKIQNVKAT